MVEHKNALVNSAPGFGKSKAEVSRNGFLTGSNLAGKNRNKSQFVFYSVLDLLSSLK